jgi:hypothetical protein
MGWFFRLFRRERIRKPTSPQRPARVTDDDDDGLAAAGVPRRPLPQNLSGGAVREIPKTTTEP